MASLEIFFGQYHTIQITVMCLEEDEKKIEADLSTAKMRLPRY